MNKKILSMAIAAITLFSVPAMAQNTGDCQKKCDKKCQADKQCKKDKQCKPAYNPFEGLNLTQQQQASIKAIPCPKQVMKEARKQSKDDASKADPKMRMQVAKDIRANYLKQVKAVLTPEQYVQFLENQYVNPRPQKQDMKHGKHKKHGKGHGMKPGKDCKGNNCSAKQAKDNK